MPGLTGRLRLRGSRPRGEAAREGPWSRGGRGGLQSQHRLGGPWRTPACTGRAQGLLCRAGCPPGSGAWPGLRIPRYLRPSGFLSRLSPPPPRPIWNSLPLVSAAQPPLWRAPGTGMRTPLQPEPPRAARGLRPAWGQRSRAHCGGPPSVPHGRAGQAWSSCSRISAWEEMWSWGLEGRGSLRGCGGG